MAEPMIKLDPHGSAPVVDYKLPDSTSYGGRHYLVLDLPAGAFRPELALEDPDIDRVRVVPGGRPATALEMLTIPGYLAVDSGDGGQLRFRSTLPVDDSLAILTVDDVAEMQRVGLRPVAVRNVSGGIGLALTNNEDLDPDLGDTNTGDGKTPAVFSIQVTTPTDGGILSVPGASMVAEVHGNVTLEGMTGPVGSVEVRIGSAGGWTTADKEDVNWGSWTARVPVSESGIHRLTARATGPGSRTHSLLVKVVLTGGPAGATAPTIAIDRPADRAIVVDPSGRATLAIAGRAVDDVAVSTVDVALDDGPWAPVQIPAPGASVSWSGQLLLVGAGSHTIKARATDNNGASQEARIQVSLARRGQRTYVRSYVALVESYRLSTFLGRYGAGRVIKTFSLLPGERTKVSIKTWQRTEESRKAASSIVDSVNSTSATEFGNALQAENTDKETSSDRFDWELKGNVEQGWGTGHASISAGASGGCNAAREEFGKTVTNVTAKHTAEASSKRDVTINNEYQATVSVGTETSIEREIQNINASRTLNFVFRQMNQEFISILHLVDVRMVVVQVYTETGREGLQKSFREARLTEVPALLAQVLVPPFDQQVYDQILVALGNVADYQDNLHDLIEEVKPKRGATPVPEAGYLRIKRDLKQEYVPDSDDPNSKIMVPGVIMSVSTNIMRTEGVIVDALLGQGEGLDSYSQGLQETAVEERTLQNLNAEQQIADQKLRAKIVKDKDAKAADIYAQLHPAATSPLELTVHGGGGDGTPAPTP